MQKRGIRAEDLYKLNSVTDPRISPDGNSCVFVETMMNKESQKYYSHLKWIPLHKKDEPVQWTFGESKNHSPRWSPDGQKIVFISNRNGKNQLFVLNVNGGEAKQITSLPRGASNPVWSPDGKRIAFSTSLRGDTRIENADQEEKTTITPLEVEEMKYKSDAEGFWNGDYKQIAVLEIETGKVEQLTTGETDHQLFCWSPDGKYLAIGADQNVNKDDSFLQDVFMLDVLEKSLTKITEGSGYFGNVTWSPNGKYLGLIGHESEFKNATLPKAWIYHLESKSMNCLTDSWDVAVGDMMISDFQYGAVNPGILWTADSESFYFLASDYGSTAVYYGNLNGEIYPALLDQQHAYGLSIDGFDKAVIAISSTIETGDLYELTVTEGKLERLTNVNENFLDEIQLSEAESFYFTGENGLNIQGWLMKPVGFEEGKKYPLILEIHGGPHMMYGNTYMHEFQKLAANGYAIVFVNPRGSHGYGQEFVDAVRGDYGGNDYGDLMSAVDYVLETYDFVDENRLGVTGGSYGGFMTNWIVGHTNRFKAAVTQRSISNWISFYGVSDIGYYFTEWQMKTDMSDIETLWKHSPLAYVKNVETPLLILHSEKDYRCPIEQAEQLFIALKRLGKQTKFVRFPGENHELSRSGHPSLRIDRLNHIVCWFNQYL
ncbi:MULTISPECIES: S9 family peptidase [unclassified Bacillus (in: firmicutes)]|uniref:S9 family peptidase n=1 Tax=unclassified Bacillus (in: firmicutes) TaxID=185979 RepID=UPI0008F28553|nr:MULTISPECIES: S9 family peptidase [unclassified Bacillus (in: firmicutes)]SFA79642.1 Dipeptidyl aminopeptidase/acylaminoacyl peptidase [Bacillus sp. UNCCL13]SFQ69695.1 Dipeptidyl aminopeptidase/acylaminoacyl peptidase [Bacillus sp. cl95]